MNEADKIVSDHGQQMVADAAALIGQDIRDIIMRAEDLVAPEMVGSELTATTPQEELRIAQLTALGRPYPSTPRFNTGFMISKLKSEIGELKADLFFPGGLEREVVLEQQYGSAGTSADGRWPFPVPARPFFGISRRALDGVEQMMERAGAKLVAALEPLQLPPIQMTV